MWSVIPVFIKSAEVQVTGCMTCAKENFLEKLLFSLASLDHLIALLIALPSIPK